MTSREQSKTFKKLIQKVKEKYTIELNGMPIDVVIRSKAYYKVIFDHDFQKALWGNLWMSEAVKMSVVVDYLEYLSKFV